MSDRQQGPALTTDGPPRGWLIAAIAVATASIAAVLAIAITSRHQQSQPVVISAVPAPQADSPDCRKLIAALPPRLGDYQRATPAGQSPPGTAAWQAKALDQPVILRCGLERPADFVIGAPIKLINAVQWFQVADADRSTWFAVDRPVYVAVTLAQGSGPTPIQQLSDVISRTLAAVPIRPGPPPG